MEFSYLTVAAIVLSVALSVEAYKPQCLTKGGAVASRSEPSSACSRR